MDGPPPPPPPPHGSNPKTTSGGLPPGNYDIFIIPPHSSGGGFLYLPSLAPQRNSFLAGVASTILAIAVWQILEPTIKQWVATLSKGIASGGTGVMMLIVAVGVLGWAWGKTQGEGIAGSSGSPPRTGGAQGAAGGPPPGYQRAQSPPNGGFPGAGPQPQTPGGGAHPGYGAPPHSHPHQHQHQQSQPPPEPEAGPEPSWSKPNPSSSSGWEKAREETRKREEERKRAEEAKKRRDEEQRRKEEAERQARAQAEKEKWEKMRAREREQREREARERIAKERLQREKEQREKDAREREAREAEARAKIEKEIREKLEAEQKAKAEEEAKKKAEKEKADKERAERLKVARERAERERETRLKAEAEKIAAGRRSATYGMGSGERTDIFAGARSPPAPSVTSTHSSPIKATVSPKKPYEKPSAKSYLGSQDSEAHSFRPYDQPKRPSKVPSQSSVYSESSYAPSQSTSRTTPPPSQRGPYSTNDPDKIQIKAVYLFNDLFPKPVAQLVAGIGNVTDGLILKITTEGLFIDDDVRNVAQREWDIKAWTMKLVETGERNGKHLLRASIRDPEGKKYVFIIDDGESWKVAVGLQRLRRGSQVRALGTNGMPAAEVRNLLTGLGFA